MKTKACLAAALLAFAAAFSLSAALPQTAAANQKVFRKVTATDKTQATALLDEGDQLRKAGRYEEAMHKYTEAIHIDESLGGYAYRALCRISGCRYFCPPALGKRPFAAGHERSC